MDEKAIRLSYKQAHDILTKRYYSDQEGFPGGKEAFDQQHGAIWSRMDAELESIGVKIGEEK